MSHVAIAGTLGNASAHASSFVAKQGTDKNKKVCSYLHTRLYTYRRDLFFTQKCEPNCTVMMVLVAAAAAFRFTAAIGSFEGVATTAT